MTMLRAIRASAFAALLVGACALNAPVSCEAVERDPPAPLTCEAAVNAARTRLAPLDDVRGIRFQYDECAPDAQVCAFLFGTAGNVIASLGDGREVAVFVSGNDAGQVVAEAPRPFTPESEPTPLP
jgi:hypothetical protein